jgi:hypothetical protein
LEAIVLDRLGVTNYPVAVTPVQGEGFAVLKARIATMQQEIQQLMVAAQSMAAGADENKKTKKLVDGLLNSRNRALSVVMSHCFIETLLGANPGQHAENDYMLACFNLYDAFHRAARMGAADAIQTRRFLKIRPTDLSAQMRWDGQIL